VARKRKTPERGPLRSGRRAAELLLLDSLSLLAPVERAEALQNRDAEQAVLATMDFHCLLDGPKEG